MTAATPTTSTTATPTSTPPTAAQLAQQLATAQQALCTAEEQAVDSGTPAAWKAVEQQRAAVERLRAQHRVAADREARAAAAAEAAQHAAHEAELATLEPQISTDFVFENNKDLIERVVGVVVSLGEVFEEARKRELELREKAARVQTLRETLGRSEGVVYAPEVWSQVAHASWDATAKALRERGTAYMTEAYLRRVRGAL